jgi:hypothetical protein
LDERIDPYQSMGRMSQSGTGILLPRMALHRRLSSSPIPMTHFLVSRKDAWVPQPYAKQQAFFFVIRPTGYVEYYYPK